MQHDISVTEVRSAVMSHPLFSRLNQNHRIGDEDREERFTEMPADLGVTNFGLLPRERYPLVALLTLAKAEARDTYNIVSQATFAALSH